MIERLREVAVARFGPAAADLDADDDIFEALGIDSLKALDLLTDLEQTFGTEIPDYELQGVTSLRGLAEVLELHV